MMKFFIYYMLIPFLIGLLLGNLVLASEANAETLCTVRPKPNPVYQKQEVCLAQALYHEARGEPKEGRLAVAEVVLNRVAHKDYPNTICGVVQTNQFSWAGVVRETKIWERSLRTAKKIVQGEKELTNTGALFFHTVNSNPYWAAHFELITVIGNHKFYRHPL